MQTCMQTTNSIRDTCKQSKVTNTSLPLTPKGRGGALAANCGESTRQASCLIYFLTLLLKSGGSPCLRRYLDQNWFSASRSLSNHLRQRLLCGDQGSVFYVEKIIEPLILHRNPLCFIIIPTFSRCYRIFIYYIYLCDFELYLDLVFSVSISLLKILFAFD